MKAGTIFDNVLITEDENDVKEMAAAWKTQSEGEKKMKDAQDEEQRKKDEEERKKMEEEEKAKEAEKGDDEDDEDAGEGEDLEMPDDMELPEEVNISFKFKIISLASFFFQFCCFDICRTCVRYLQWFVSISDSPT